MLPGPALGGKISLTDTAVVIQAGLAKISVTPAGVVIEVGGTTFELSLAGIKQAVGITEMQVELAGITQKCAENTVQLNAALAKIDAAMVDVMAMFELNYSAVVMKHLETAFITD
jgi:hypothetical protein